MNNGNASERRFSLYLNPTPYALHDLRQKLDLLQKTLEEGPDLMGSMIIVSLYIFEISEERKVLLKQRLKNPQHELSLVITAYRKALQFFRALWKNLKTQYEEQKSPAGLLCYQA